MEENYVKFYCFLTRIFPLDKVTLIQGQMTDERIKMNFVFGAIISFLFGACLPVLKVGIPVLLNGAVPDYYLARLQIAWHIGLLKMTVSGVIVCLIYMIIMFIIKKKLNSKTSRNSQP